jgi:DNA-directed RNA polymerase subunit RPC12/RpoP
MRVIDPNELSSRMYHEAFEKDSDMQRWDGGCWIRYKVFENCLADTPVIDAEEIRYGEWVYCEDENGQDGYKCSKCNFFVPWYYSYEDIEYIKKYHYCPNCGAKMR